MFDTLLIITLFLLASLLVRLLTLRLSINIKHLSLFSFITNVNGLLKIPTTPRLLEKSSTPFPRLFWAHVIFSCNLLFTVELDWVSWDISCTTLSEMTLTVSSKSSVPFTLGYCACICMAKPRSLSAWTCMASRSSFDQSDALQKCFSWII